MRKTRFPTLAQVNCPRCGKPVYSRIESIFGADETRKKYAGICAACIKPEEAHEINMSILQAATRSAGNGK